MLVYLVRSLCMVQGAFIQYLLRIGAQEGSDTGRSWDLFQKIVLNMDYFLVESINPDI